MRREGITSVGSVILAFLASQHHTLHMLLLAVGVGGAGMSFMQAFPLVRRFMLLLSLVMAAVTAYQTLRRHRPTVMQVMGGISVALTLGLVVWSTLQFGL